jgi:hypothetical protein
VLDAIEEALEAVLAGDGAVGLEQGAGVVGPPGEGGDRAQRGDGDGDVLLGVGAEGGIAQLGDDLRVAALDEEGLEAGEEDRGDGGGVGGDVAAEVGVGEGFVGFWTRIGNGALRLGPFGASLR